MSPLPLQKFERYTIEAQLGEGGMGTVYLAYDARLERRVALKVLRPGAEDAVASALREARAAAAIAHPNATAIFDADELSGTAFLVMEYVPGTSLRALIARPPLPLATRLRWLVDIADALAAAHQVGVVHRDIKPENVMVRDDGLVKVLDFGVARRTPDDAASLGQVTPSGPLVGTPAYMAPEQMRGELIDGRADQFAWGVLAFELCTGRLPWRRARDFIGYLTAVMTEEPDPPSRESPSLAPEVEAIILKALAKSASDRFPSMAAVAAALAPHAGPAMPLLSPDAMPSSRVRTTPPKGTEVAPTSAPPPVSAPRRSSPRPPATSMTTLTSVARVAEEDPTPSSRFRLPRFEAPVDVDAHLALLPAGATCKGMFFLDLLKLGATAMPAAEVARAAGIPERRYVAFRDYPMADNMRLSVAVARALYPRKPLGEGLRRIGQTAFDTVLATHLGRALFGVLGRDVEALLMRGPKAYELVMSFGHVTVEKIDWRTFVVRMRDLPVFLETHQVGVLEGLLRHCDEHASIRVELASLSAGALELRLS